METREQLQQKIEELGLTKWAFACEVQAMGGMTAVSVMRFLRAECETTMPKFALMRKVIEAIESRPITTLHGDGFVCLSICPDGRRASAYVEGKCVAWAADPDVHDKAIKLLAEAVTEQIEENDALLDEADSIADEALS